MALHENESVNHSHRFGRRTVWSAVHCRSCGKLLYGMYRQGLWCRNRGCRFVVHERNKCFMEALEKPCLGEPESDEDCSSGSLPTTPNSRHLSECNSPTQANAEGPTSRQQRMHSTSIGAPMIYRNEDDFSERYHVDFNDAIAKGQWGAIYGCHVVGERDELVAKVMMTQKYRRTGLLANLNREVALLTSEVFRAHWGLCTAVAVCLLPQTCTVVMIKYKGCLVAPVVQSILAADPLVEQSYYRWPTRNQGLAEPVTQHLFWQLLHTVQYLHSLRPMVIHRDLKPQNVLVSPCPNGPVPIRVVLTDFGVAKELDLQARATSEVGSHHYMAPEVGSAAGYTEKADMWSLGGILYTLLTGKDFSQAVSQKLQPAEGQEAVAKALLDCCNWLSEEVLTLARSLLVKDPHKRLSTRQALRLPWLQAVTTPELERFFPPVQPKPYWTRRPSAIASKVSVSNPLPAVKTTRAGQDLLSCVFDCQSSENALYSDGLSVMSEGGFNSGHPVAETSVGSDTDVDWLGADTLGCAPVVVMDFPSSLIGLSQGGPSKQSSQWA